jgi:O-antigen/teichoic acid export membrane protein
MSFTATLASNALYRVCNLVVLFLITVLLSRLMGVEGYGLLSLLIVNGTLFNLITSFGADSGITYNIASRPIKVSRILTIVFSILLLQILLLGITETISYLLNGHLWLLKTKEQKFWWIGLSFLLGISLQEKYTAVLNGSHLYTLCNKTILLCNFFSLLVFALFFFVSEPQDFNLYLILFVLVNLLQAVALLVISHIYIGVPFRFMDLKKEDLSLFFSYYFFVFLINIIKLLAYRIDFWILDFYRDEKELGWYSLAVRLAQLYWIFPLLFASIIFPKIVSAKADYNENKMLALLRTINVVNFLAGVMLFFFISPLIVAIFGKEYQSSALGVCILLPGVILFGNTIILAAYFAGINKLKVNFWGSLLCFISIFLLDLIFIPVKGFIGAALASSIGYFLTTVYFVIMYCRRNDQNVTRLFFPRKNDWKHLQSFTKNIFTKS